MLADTAQSIMWITLARKPFHRQAPGTIPEWAKMLLSSAATKDRAPGQSERSCQYFQWSHPSAASGLSPAFRINAKIAGASFGVDGRMRTFIAQIPQRAWGRVAPTVR